MELKSGDMIDVSLEIPKSEGDFEWVQAKILAVLNEDNLKLNFIFDYWKQNTIINKWTIKIEQSTILDIQERKQSNSDHIIKMAFIGYRVYCEQGNKEDEMGSFYGWSSRYDEWIPLYSLRIRPLLTQTLKKRNPFNLIVSN
ncbi:UNKNOWN [Stylonychia lemnae]|uniref:Uncharacterized protein n=1 Tax=Stylonychia lemnae TaxID=5949 RepID=A0A078A307_STYLE|nr:UNKNOWN [Stylonychia lemnae]|eukprot:CDW75154.1 UNKNOWN [Stylonychia lemnae]